MILPQDGCQHQQEGLSVVLVAERLERYQQEGRRCRRTYLDKVVQFEIDRDIDDQCREDERCHLAEDMQLQRYRDEGIDEEYHPEGSPQCQH